MNGALVLTWLRSLRNKIQRIKKGRPLSERSTGTHHPSVHSGGGEHFTPHTIIALHDLSIKLIQRHKILEALSNIYHNHC